MCSKQHDLDYGKLVLSFRLVSDSENVVSKPNLHVFVIPMKRLHNLMPQLHIAHCNQPSDYSIGMADSHVLCSLSEITCTRLHISIL